MKTADPAECLLRKNISLRLPFHPFTRGRHGLGTWIMTSLLCLFDEAVHCFLFLIPNDQFCCHGSTGTWDLGSCLPTAPVSAGSIMFGVVAGRKQHHLPLDWTSNFSNANVTDTPLYFSWLGIPACFFVPPRGHGVSLSLSSHHIWSRPRFLHMWEVYYGTCNFAVRLQLWKEGCLRKQRTLNRTGCSVLCNCGRRGMLELE